MSAGEDRADTRRVVSESLAERMIDTMVATCMRSDPAYVHAESLEDQAAAERAIMDRVEQSFASMYRVAT